MPDAPLSIVLTGRNDNYGGDFTTRLARTLRFNWTQLQRHDVACEIVFVEWNPVSGRPPLCEVLREELPDIEISRYLVDRRYHGALTQNARLDYLEYVAKNVGIRRARGALVLVTNTDIFLSRGVIEALARGDLAREVVYRAPRIDLALGTDQSGITWEGLEDPSAHARRPTLQPPLYAGGSGDFLLLDAGSWRALRGFNECYRVARVGVDHNFLVKAFGCGHRIADIGSPVYHVNHPGSYRISKTTLQGAAAESAWGKRNWPSRHVVYDNPDGWGLGGAPEHVLPGGTRCLDFDWQAVAPIAELRRVVLPLRRAADAD